MKKYRKYCYDISVSTPDNNFWFQNGKLTLDADINWELGASSHKGFRTRKKMVTFLRWLEIAHPDAIVDVGEFQKDRRYFFHFKINGEK